MAEFFLWFREKLRKFNSNFVALNITIPVTMKLFILLSVLAVVAAQLEQNCRTLFEDFKVKFQRSYANADEESKRLGIFCQSMKRADENNKINGEAVFGVTKFSDKTLDEFKVLLGRRERKLIFFIFTVLIS